MPLQKTNTPKLNKILGGMYFVNSSMNYKSMIEPNIYFNVNENKLKYIKGKSNGFFIIFWSTSIKNEKEANINLIINDKMISSKKTNSSENEIIINDEIIYKLSLNDEIWLEIETDDEYLISSVHLLVIE